MPTCQDRGTARDRAGPLSGSLDTGWADALVRVVRRLESHDDVRVLFGGARGGFGVHARGIVFLAGTHARSGNIQECQYARARALDDANRGNP